MEHVAEAFAGFTKEYATEDLTLRHTLVNMHFILQNW